MTTKKVVVYSAVVIATVAIGGIIIASTDVGKALQSKFGKWVMNLNQHGDSSVLNALTADVVYGKAWSDAVDSAGGGASILQDTDGNPVVIPLIGVGA